MAERITPRPFLKWAGGKTQIVDRLMAHLPPRFNGYHEPFLGSGALFFALKRKGMLRRACLSDANQELIGTYTAVRDRVGDVINILSEYRHNRTFYYALRARDPRELDGPELAARMIYLNKTGYNGLYRVNRQGMFNVPFGRYRSPGFLDRDNLIGVAQALVKITILCTPFETVIRRARKGDFVYFDPPYAPLSSTSNFTGYQAGGFAAEDQERLRDLCIALKKKGVQAMVSNSDTPFVRGLYTGRPFAVHTVLAKRAINSKAGKRGRITELIITNY